MGPAPDGRRLDGDCYLLGGDSGRLALIWTLPETSRSARLQVSSMRSAFWPSTSRAQAVAAAAPQPRCGRAWCGDRPADPSGTPAGSRRTKLRRATASPVTTAQHRRGGSCLLRRPPARRSVRLSHRLSARRPCDESWARRRDDLSRCAAAPGDRSTSDISAIVSRRQSA